MQHASRARSVVDRCQNMTRDTASTVVRVIGDRDQP
jgi:hypothetical protein